LSRLSQNNNIKATCVGRLPHDRAEAGRLADVVSPGENPAHHLANILGTVVCIRTSCCICAFWKTAQQSIGENPSVEFDEQLRLAALSFHASEARFHKSAVETS